jgi:hypothetical protein
VRDLLFVLVVIGFFALAALFVRGCELLIGSDHEETAE